MTPQVFHSIPAIRMLRGQHVGQIEVVSWSTSVLHELIAPPVPWAPRAFDETCRLRKIEFRAEQEVTTWIDGRVVRIFHATVPKECAHCGIAISPWWQLYLYERDLKYWLWSCEACAFDREQFTPSLLLLKAFEQSEAWHMQQGKVS